VLYIYNPAWLTIRILFTGFKDKQKSAGRDEETGGIPSAKKTTLGIIFHHTQSLQNTLIFLDLPYLINQKWLKTAFRVQF